MSRTLSLTFRQEHDAETSGMVDVLLLTIDHADLAEPIRLSSDPTERLTTDPLVYGTTSRGETYEFLPFSWVYPEDGEEAPTTIPIRIANFNRELITLLRSTSTPAAVTCELVAASAPDDVELEFPDFDLIDMSYDDEAITINLGVESLVSEPVPAGSFAPSGFPGLF